MIPIGKFSELTITRQTENGMYLKDAFGEEVLLPNKYCTPDHSIGSRQKVFVYLDSQARKTATTLTPKIQLNEVALLKVNAVSQSGAFLDWGLEKDLFVPFKEQSTAMEEGQSYIVILSVDHQTGRLFASSKLDNHLNFVECTLQPGEEVELLVIRESDLGFVVIVNHKFEGLIYKNEIFKAIKVGDQLSGYVKKVREDNKVDISLQPIGYTNYIDPNMELIYQELKNNKGFLPFGDKSNAEAIYKRFGISKKAFKKAIGALYKERKIEMTAEGIRSAK